MTLSMVVFVYGLIAFLVYLIAAINIQLFKKIADHYPVMDVVFYILLNFSFTYISREILQQQKNFCFTWSL